jgi:transcription antitermination factor nusB
MNIGRRRGRILAFQALCAWEMGSALEDLLQFTWQSEKLKTPPDEKTFLFPALIVTGAVENIKIIDALISENLDNWAFERINSVDKAILRISVYSLLFQKDIPAAVVIDEAINLAKEFGTDDSYKFVNAVLDSIKKTA